MPFKKGNIPHNKGKKEILTFKCICCGKIFKKQRGHTHKGIRKFCSLLCRYRHCVGKNSPSYKPESYIKKQCLNCKKYFITRPKNINRGGGLFCSHKCVSDY